MAKFYDAEAVKQAVPILDYCASIGLEVRNNRCKAPWHPSGGDNPQAVSISPTKGTWFDFVESRGGSVIDLCMAVEGRTFPDALRKLGEAFNVPATDGTRTRNPKPKPKIEPNFVCICQAIKTHDIDALDEVSIIWARRVMELANGATDAASLDVAVTAAIDEYHREKNQAATEDGELRNLGIEYEDAADFMRREIEPPKWIIPDFIAKHYQCALYGKSKSHKTFFGLNLAERLALGQPFLKFPAPTEPCKLAYFNLELMPYFTQERMSKQLGDLKKRLPKGRFFVFNLRGKASVLRDHTEAIVRWLKANEIDLAVVDPRYKLMSGDEDENSAAGLRALLDFRTQLADACAVLLIGHDPKGDVATRAATDRGAGSYTAIADDDATILLDPNANGGDGVEALTVRTIHRNRKQIDPFVATFDGETLTFATDETIPADMNLNKSATSLTSGEKAKRNRDKFALFAQAAKEVADEHGDNLIDCTTFKAELLIKPSGTVMGTSADSKPFKFAWRLLTEGDGKILKKCKVQEVKSDGTNGSTRTRREYVSTPERIDRYLAQFTDKEDKGVNDTLPLCPC